jgi:hypothetical protein
LVTHADGRQTVEEVKNDMGLKAGDKQGLVARLRAQGVAAAAVLLTLLNELLRDFEQYRMIVFALLLIVLMIVRPQGLLGNFQRKKRKAPQG